MNITNQFVNEILFVIDTICKIKFIRSIILYHMKNIRIMMIECRKWYQNCPNDIPSGQTNAIHLGLCSTFKYYIISHCKILKGNLIIIDTDIHLTWLSDVDQTCWS